MHEDADLEQVRMLKSSEVAELVGVSMRTLWRLLAAGRFPEPVRFNRKVMRWKRADVVQWLKDLPTGRS